MSSSRACSASSRPIALTTAGSRPSEKFGTASSGSDIGRTLGPVETVCVRVRLEPGSLPRVREWAAELNARRDEVMATLRDEGVRIESVFLEGETLVYFLKALR